MKQASEIQDDIVELYNDLINLSPPKKKLDEQEIIPRKNFYSNPKKLKDDFEILDKLALKDNTLFGWVKSFFFRNKDH